MSILNKLPLTTFKLPSGETIESRNILKTIVFSKQTKQNPNILKKIFSVNTAKIENVSYDFYNDNAALYWLTMHLNDIDSFENAPVPQTKFEQQLSNRFPGTSYQIYQGKNPKFILPGDMIIISVANPSDSGTVQWKNAGIVKEYDEAFRRIILKREVSNDSNTGVISVDGGANPDIEIYRKTGVSWNEITEVDDDGVSTDTVFKLGFREPELDKIVGFYNPDLNGELRSTFSNISTSSFDFTDTPSDTTLIRIYSDTANASYATLFTSLGFYKHTLRNEEIRKNTKTNTLSFFELGRAYEVTSFVNTLLGGSFKRGQSINVSG
jgi:hypothetical protein